MFLTSQIGVLVFNAPHESAGSTIKIQGDEVSLGSTEHGDGKSRVLAFADPKEFAARFGACFNGEMMGAEIVKVVLRNPECKGVLLNSATSEASVAIERADLIRSSGNPVTNRAWWKFWK